MSVLTGGVDFEQSLVLTFFSGSSVSVTAPLHGSGLLSGDSLPADLQHVHSHHGDVKENGVIYLPPSVKRWQCNDSFVQP